jgi:hypothetical protein
MNREIVSSVKVQSAIVAGGGDAFNARAQRVRDRLGLDSPVSSASAEESLVIDDRCELSPAQLVETKLTRVLGGGMVPVSLLQMRGCLHRR